MKVIGVIGGIGSGKSEITNYISKNFRAYVIIADQIGHEVLKKDSIAFQAIVNHYGREILDTKGNINRKALGDIVFNDKNELNWLNNITHPLIYDKVIGKINEVKKSQLFDIIIFEAAIMVEANWLELVDFVWLVTCAEEIRIERLIKSRNLSENKIKNIISNQQNDNELKKIADLVIDNSNDRELTFHHVHIETLKVLEAKNEKL